MVIYLLNYPDQFFGGGGEGGGDFHTVAVTDVTSRITKFTLTGFTRQLLLSTDHTYYCPYDYCWDYSSSGLLSPSTGCAKVSFIGRIEDGGGDKCKYTTRAEINGDNNMAVVDNSESAAPEFRFSP
jgi:hypothetical protein